MHACCVSFFFSYPWIFEHQTNHYLFFHVSQLPNIANILALLLPWMSRVQLSYPMLILGSNIFVWQYYCEDWSIWTGLIGSPRGLASYDCHVVEREVHVRSLAEMKVASAGRHICQSSHPLYTFWVCWRSRSYENNFKNYMIIYIKS